MTDFTVHHGPLADANSGLAVSLSTVGQILEDLNTTLRNMNEAAQGQALPLWADDQNAWNSRYGDMQTQLAAHHADSVHIGNIYQDGDNQGARIMGG